MVGSTAIVEAIVSALKEELEGALAGSESAPQPPIANVPPAAGAARGTRSGFHSDVLDHLEACVGGTEVQLHSQWPS